MKREDHLKYCRVCTQQEFDLKVGVICGLTGKIAQFTKTCDSFKIDEVLKEKIVTNKATLEILEQSAGLGKRLANYILDFIFIMVISFVIMTVLNGLLMSSTLANIIGNSIVNEYILGMTLIMIYYVSFESSSGRTLAKFITKTKVVTESGDKPQINTILLRSICRFIPFEALSFLDSESSGWHDKLSKTKVINI